MIGRENFRWNRSHWAPRLPSYIKYSCSVRIIKFDWSRVLWTKTSHASHCRRAHVSWLVLRVKYNLSWWELQRCGRWVTIVLTKMYNASMHHYVNSLWEWRQIRNEIWLFEIIFDKYESLSIMESFPLSRRYRIHPSEYRQILEYSFLKSVGHNITLV